MVLLCPAGPSCKLLDLLPERAAPPTLHVGIWEYCYTLVQCRRHTLHMYSISCMCSEWMVFMWHYRWIAVSSLFSFLYSRFNIWILSSPCTFLILHCMCSILTVSCWVRLWAAVSLTWKRRANENSWSMCRLLLGLGEVTHTAPIDEVYLVLLHSQIMREELMVGLWIVIVTLTLGSCQPLFLFSLFQSLWT